MANGEPCLRMSGGRTYARLILATTVAEHNESYSRLDPCALVVPLFSKFHRIPLKLVWQARRGDMAVQALLIPKAGPAGYYHRELLIRTPEGRRVDLITVTDCHGILVINVYLDCCA